MVSFHHPMNHNGACSPQTRNSGRRVWILRTVRPWRARCSLAHCCGLAHKSRSPGQGRSRDRGPDAKTERLSARSCRVQTRQGPPCNTGAAKHKDSYWLRICGSKNPSTTGRVAAEGGLHYRSWNHVPAVTVALFWAITQRVVVIPYRRFGTTYRSRLEGSRIFLGSFRVLLGFLAP